MSHIIVKPHNKYNFLRSTNKLVVPRFNTYFMKHYCTQRFNSMECVGMEWHRSSLETNNTDVLLLHFLEIPCLKFLERDLICDFNLISDTVLGTQERALVEGLLEQYNSWRRPVTSSSSEATLVNISIRLVQIFEMVWCAQMCGHIITVMNLTKIPIVSSVSQIAISESSCNRPPPVSDRLPQRPPNQNPDWFLCQSNCYQ